MNQKSLKGWMKHWDFILIDIICLQLCFAVAFRFRIGYGSPYSDTRFQFQPLLLLVSQLLVVVFSDNYSGILRRNRFDELLAVISQTAQIIIVSVIGLFIMHRSADASRLIMGYTTVLYPAAAYVLHLANKRRLFAGRKNKEKRSIVLITSAAMASDAMHILIDQNSFRDYFIPVVMIMDKTCKAESDAGTETFEISDKYPDTEAMQLSEENLKKLSHEWVDEVLILQPDEMPYPSELADMFLNMGITVNYTLPAINSRHWHSTEIEKIGAYHVLSNSLRFASPGQLAIKRLMDIAGGLVGCVLTGMVFLVIAPAIYAADPGPIFFSQTRVGKNGRTFKMYKFRSMYMDAEQRKRELAEKNKMSGGLMFKIDDDPRIIGSEKKDKNGNPRGIGNFIRRTSLDEFPQFFNVLMGSMSLVGWRPATLDEWEKYDLEHRVRAGMKPGITGMWQVSGRSGITDFEEVVRLDRKYIENWNIRMDIRILVKTVAVVLLHKGAV
ncbi:MAG: sugar transferase [Eubacteriales bacterium]|nr:sugar transferase [Eubacteriales bacterium]